MTRAVEPAPLAGITLDKGSLSIDLQDVPLATVVTDIATRSGIKLHMENAAALPRVTAHFTGLPFAEGLARLLKTAPGSLVVRNGKLVAGGERTLCDRKSRTGGTATDTSTGSPGRHSSQHRDPAGARSITGTTPGLRRRPRASARRRSAVAQSATCAESRQLVTRDRRRDRTRQDTDRRRIRRHAPLSPLSRPPARTSDDRSRPPPQVSFAASCDASCKP